MSVDPTAPTASFPPPGGAAPPPAFRPTMLLVPATVAAAVAVVLGVYGKVHDPAGTAFNLAGFSSTQSVKSWLATASFTFALIQLGSALVMYGKVPGITAPGWIGALHRWSGRIAFLIAIPVAVHCLYALGYQTYSARVLWHSLLGCFFFGAFSAKMLLLRRQGLPGWVLPLLGGLVFTVLVVVWLTSAYWFFSTSGLSV